MKYRALYPPSILGVMGSGQLGRMFTHSASKLGYHVHCYSPIFDSPTKYAGATEFVGKYTDLNKLGEFLDSVDALTFEFENIPEEALLFIEEYIETEGLRVFPSPKVIRISNNRIKEKNFFLNIGIPVTNFLSLQGKFTDINKLSDIKFPAILKTNQFGYDGKGQRKYNTREDFLILKNLV
ncbi:MAG: ATP-grasp domain-containing protein [Spirochaetia bacterium]|nr:ATP-grasp domain-containing protein [Spirochaetia bacterium]